MGMSTPYGTHQGPSRHGGIPATQPQCELGSITAVQADRYTYSVRTNSGRTLQGVPRKRMSPSDNAILPISTTVLIRSDIGIPYIDGVLDMPATVPDTAGISATGVAGYGGQGNDVSTNPMTGNFRGANEPTDLMPGDHVLVHQSGALVGALAGGVAVLRGSGTAQVRAFSLNDLIEIISRNYRHVTDMGVFEIRNRDGRVNMSFRGASDQANEAAATEENWTIRLDLGAEGDLFNFELTEPQGQTLFRLHVDSSGRCLLYGRDGVITQSGAANGEPHIVEQAGDAEDRVGGNRTVTTGGDLNETVSGTRTVTVDGDATLVAGNDARAQSLRDHGIFAGRNMFLTAMGAKDGTVAAAVDVLGGHYVTKVGTVEYPSANYKVTTQQGEMAFESAMGGKIKLITRTGELLADARKMVFKTTTPDSVVLGGDTIVSHVVKYEQLEQLLRVLIQLFDNHSHPANGAPPVVKAGPIVSPMLQSLKSTRVGVGG